MTDLTGFFRGRLNVAVIQRDEARAQRDEAIRQGDILARFAMSPDAARDVHALPIDKAIHPALAALIAARPSLDEVLREEGS